MDVRMMAFPSDWNADEGYKTEVGFSDLELTGPVYLVRLREMDGNHKRGEVEVWMTREQLEAHVETLTRALEMPQVDGAKVTSEKKGVSA